MAVTQTPRKTRFRAVAGLTRAGLDPQDLFGRFPNNSSPFPELSRRTPRTHFYTRLEASTAQVLEPDSETCALIREAAGGHEGGELDWVEGAVGSGP